MPNFPAESWFDFSDIYNAAVRDLGHDGAIFVEVGAFLGESTFYMAEKIKKSGKKIKFYVIDTWDTDFLTSTKEREVLQGKYFFTTFVENLLPLMEFIYPIRLPSTVAASIFGDGAVDFVFIDASHRYEDVKVDIQAWWPKTKRTIAGHDIDFPDVRRAVKETFNQDFIIKHRSWIHDRSRY